MGPDELKEVIKNIKTGADASADFKEYLENRIDNVSYSKERWPSEWRQVVYSFGDLFSKSKINANPYLRVLKEVKEDNEEKEVFDFIYSEIIWNLFEQNPDYIKDELKDLLKKYPSNPEFHHTYSHYLQNNKNYEKAIFEAKIAHKIEPENTKFSDTYFNKIKTFFDHLLLKSRLEAAKDLLNDNMEFAKNLSGTIQWEVFKRFSAMQDRLHDHKAIEQKVRFFEKEIENTLKIEQRKLIEILGIFSAIIAFILTNITIFIGNLTPKQAMFLMLGMALVLMIFVFSISFLFGPRYRYANWKWFITRPKLWTIIALFLLLFGMFYITPDIDDYRDSLDERFYTKEEINNKLVPILINNEK